MREIAPCRKAITEEGAKAHGFSRGDNSVLAGMII
jgi:hypothetical protein